MYHPTLACRLWTRFQKFFSQFRERGLGAFTAVNSRFVNVNQDSSA